MAAVLNVKELFSKRKQVDWTNGKKIVGKIVAIIRIEPKVLKLGKKGSCHGKERSNS